jgi:hypothetical protein
MRKKLTKGGRAKPETDLVRTSLVLPGDLWERARAAAARERTNLRQFIMQAIEDRLAATKR